MEQFNEVAFTFNGTIAYISNGQKKEREEGRKREPQSSTISYGPPKSRISGMTFHFCWLNFPIFKSFSKKYRAQTNFYNEDNSNVSMYLLRSLKLKLL